ncbi:uncharacterized protein L969DRAFT_104405 [Mixia osmundae IAM 14324]|uniref:YbgI/family dinuclear metal center protein n=1 Tax=Mixia osmundae (strain CBS 9802 / IAM 14324 / JCM 22182 / KY 12970) TaxID=764103 RepID=G7E7Z1_MIXOS|nr:uncharacterized protein L969DRAFT_104405 [Mixia osmundae IAM 14324]KEI38550.1 hypothetical protein L969DRAFT_104405 [Mixia osmundae IAM 14324]GAA98951.1 hypothetical protein E5Q_05639 [Mixia osmundae IAM 14324]
MALSPLGRAVARSFDKIAPLSLAESWDNVGWLLQAARPRTGRPGRTVVLTIDLTTAVYRNLPEDTGIVVAYHPTLFSSIKQIGIGNNALQASILGLARDGISLYSPHTCLDAAVGGINTWLASAFDNVSDAKVCRPVANPPAHHEGAGLGKQVQLSSDVELDEAVKRIKSHLNLKTVMLARSDQPRSQRVRSIAICAGSGGSVIGNADADLLWTGEMSHHEILAATARGTHVVLCNHSNTERGYLHTLKRKLEEELSTDPQAESEAWRVIIAQEDRDPLDDEAASQNTFSVVSLRCCSGAQSSFVDEPRHKDKSAWGARVSLEYFEATSVIGKTAARSRT